MRSKEGQQPRITEFNVPLCLHPDNCPLYMAVNRHVHSHASHFFKSDSDTFKMDFGLSKNDSGSLLSLGYIHQLYLETSSPGHHEITDEFPVRKSQLQASVELSCKISCNSKNFLCRVPHHIHQDSNFSVCRTMNHRGITPPDCKQTL